ncbi:MAG TPA: hypothetical protein VMS09_14505 [Paenibacillus sp.]|uniref:hypothetical protein n=1 Tax=Paenibacillus sp. TaxID=58172 RepID=UPI0028D6E4E5|nr:hypothetical protein [Paenibacillus sp.]HUC93213.1 hypothetical protein [Paenibacillus sp.]
MAEFELNASFPEERTAREAQRKLQALRITSVTAGEDGMSFSACVEDGVIERAAHLIRETGGTANWH